MSMVIKAAKTVRPLPSDDGDSSVRLASRAALECLAEAGLSPDSVGVLINVGVYRESNTFEPAIAALVQKEVGINLDYLASPAPVAGFSFDLMNGACGVLNAVQVAQALLETGSTDRVLITAADAHPGGRAVDDDAYPYADLGGALLLERAAQPGTGFGPVQLRSGDGPTGTRGYLDTSAMGTNGRGMITVERDTDRVETLLDLAADTVNAYARTEGLDLDRTLLLCTRAAPDFADRLARRLGLDPRSVLAPAAEGADGEPHTAAPVVGYLQAQESGWPAGKDQLLLVAVGAGPSAACVSYRPQDR
jgi:3-oxoacyl-[acyl-carrier-protein] synthase-3